MTGTTRIAVTLLVSVAWAGGCDEERSGSSGASNSSARRGSGAGAAPAAKLSPTKAAAITWAKAVAAGDLAAAKAASVGDAAQMKGLERIVASVVSESKLDAALAARGKSHLSTGIL